MAGGSRVFSGGRGNASNLSVLLQNQNGPCTSQPLDALFLSASSSSPSFLASRSMVSFEDVKGGKGSFFRVFDHDENVDDGMDEYFHQPEKKRRLTADQVQSLEKSFEVENKLEPERKVQLAKDLGLQPRQVAIWFQNRRARWKTKQLEKDYDSLQASFNSLKGDYENLLKEQEELKAEVANLTEKVLLREKKERNIEAETNILLDPQQKPLSDSPASEGEGSKVSVGACKQEDMSSAKSDIIDSDSPHYTDGVHSSLLEAGDSSYVFDADQSDLSQDDEEDNLSKALLPTYIFPKLEEVDYTDPPDTCNFGFPVEDQAFWSWPF